MSVNNTSSLLLLPEGGGPLVQNTLVYVCTCWHHSLRHPRTALPARSDSSCCTRTPVHGHTHSHTHWTESPSPRKELKRHLIRNGTDCGDQVQGKARQAHQPATCLHATNCLSPYLSLFLWLLLPEIHPFPCVWSHNKSCAILTCSNPSSHNVSPTLSRTHLGLVDSSWWVLSLDTGSEADLRQHGAVGWCGQGDPSSESVI